VLHDGRHRCQSCCFRRVAKEFLLVITCTLHEPSFRYHDRHCRTFSRVQANFTCSSMCSPTLSHQRLSSTWTRLMRSSTSCCLSAALLVPDRLPLRCVTEFVAFLSSNETLRLLFRAGATLLSFRRHEWDNWWCLVAANGLFSARNRNQLRRMAKIS
jgi:hypothetical protein